MVTTLDDLKTGGRALVDGRLIGAALQAERIARSRAVTNGPTYDRYVLGIGILHGWWGHTGSALGWQAATFYDPRTQSSIAVAVNATPVGSAEDLNLAEEIFKELAGVVESF
jgi:D-alanyl-D-alanine carboxypeptidase